MWLSDLYKAVRTIKDKYQFCCINNITPRADGGINFYLSNFNVVVWHKDGTVTEHKTGEWRNS